MKKVENWKNTPKLDSNQLKFKYLKNQKPQLHPPDFLGLCCCVPHALMDAPIHNMAKIANVHLTIFLDIIKRKYVFQ